MNATIIALNSGTDVLLTKKQLATALDRSERWIELKQHEGLPIATTDRFGRRRYNLQAVERWLQADRPPPRSTAERLAELEREVADLRAMLTRGAS